MMVCRTHFEDRSGSWEERSERSNACSECKSLRAAEDERIQREHTIVPSVRYGTHIPLVCTAEGCGARYSTKNIDFIGARNVFADDRDCAHPLSALVPA